MALQRIGGSFAALIGQGRSERLPGAHNLVHHGHGKGPGTDSRIADAHLRQLGIQQGRMFLYGVRQGTHKLRIALLCGLTQCRFAGFDGKKFISADETFQVFSGDAFLTGKTRAYIRLQGLRLFIRVADFPADIGGPIQILHKRLAAHIMHDITRRIVCAKIAAPFAFQQIFKDLAQHFRIDGHFLFQRLVFAHRKIITVKRLQNGPYAAVGKRHIHAAPVIAAAVAQRVEQTAVQEGNTTAKPLMPAVFPGAIPRQRIIEERFQIIVKEAMAVCLRMGFIQFVQPLAAAAPPRLLPFHAKPAFAL